MMTSKAKLEGRIAKLREREMQPPKGKKKKQGGGKRKRAAAAPAGGTVGPAAKRAQPAPTEVLLSACKKLQRAGWDPSAAVGGKGGKRADRLNVGELKVLLASRGWTLAAKVKATQDNLKARAVEGCKAAREAANAALPAAAASPAVGSDADARTCWGELVDSVMAPAGCDGTGDQQQEAGSDASMGDEAMADTLWAQGPEAAADEAEEDNEPPEVEEDLELVATECVECEDASSSGSSEDDSDVDDDVDDGVSDADDGDDAGDGDGDGDGARGAPECDGRESSSSSEDHGD